MDWPSWITAISALITAGATIAIAVWGIASWRLYSLEKRRQEGTTAAAREELSQACLAALIWLEKIIAHVDDADPSRVRQTQELRDIIDYLLERKDMARIVGPEAVRLLGDVWRLWKPAGIEDAVHGGESELGDHLRDVRNAVKKLLVLADERDIVDPAVKIVRSVPRGN